MWVLYEIDTCKRQCNLGDAMKQCTLAYILCFPTMVDSFCVINLFYRSPGADFNTVYTLSFQVSKISGDESVKEQRQKSLLSIWENIKIEWLFQLLENGYKIL